MTTSRKQYSPERKVAILREHLLEAKAVSDVCERHQIHPTQFYQWQKQLFENGTAAFTRPSRPQSPSKDEEKVRRLEEKIKQKDTVMAELLQEHILLKKELGEI
jgi:transposase-like protein